MSSGADGGETTKNLKVHRCTMVSSRLREWPIYFYALYHGGWPANKSPGSGLLQHGHNSKRPNNAAQQTLWRSAEDYYSPSHHRPLFARWICPPDIHIPQPTWDTGPENSQRGGSRTHTSSLPGRGCADCGTARLVLAFQAAACLLEFETCLLLSPGRSSHASEMASGLW
jgi:hypothetical protein